jgi:hypothetical protein
MTGMDITIHQTLLPHDVGYGGMRWITVGPADQPGTSIVLEPPAADPVGCRLGVATVDFAPRRSS